MKTKNQKMWLIGAGAVLAVIVVTVTAINMQSGGKALQGNLGNVMIDSSKTGAIQDMSKKAVLDVKKVPIIPKEKAPSVELLPMSVNWKLGKNVNLLNFRIKAGSNPIVLTPKPTYNLLPLTFGVTPAVESVMGISQCRLQSAGISWNSIESGTKWDGTPKHYGSFNITANIDAYGHQDFQLYCDISGVSSGDKLQPMFFVVYPDGLDPFGDKPPLVGPTFVVP